MNSWSGSCSRVSFQMALASLISFLILSRSSKKVSFLTLYLFSASCLFIRPFLILFPWSFILHAFILTGWQLRCLAAPCPRNGYRVNHLLIFLYPCTACMVFYCQCGNCLCLRKQCREPSLREGSCLFLNRKCISSWVLQLQPSRFRYIPGNVLWGRVSRRDLFPFRCKTHISSLLP